MRSTPKSSKNRAHARKHAASVMDKIAFGVDNFRHSLAHIDALPQMTILGLLSGVLAAGLIVLFRLVIDTPLGYIFHTTDFESLSTFWRFTLPFGGAILIGLLLQSLKPSKHQVSVPHVLARLHQFQGRMPLSNIVVQFVAGAMSQISGQSLGREGPAVHLGAGIASQLGQWLKLPNNSLRILVGCGVASAISASFDTPIAGVIFAMEVVLMEYSITGFIPVILASVVGTTISKAVFEQSLNFDSLDSRLESLWEMPFIALGGILVALAAGALIHLHLWVLNVNRLPIVVKASIAGLVTGLIAIWLPAIMGNGYDTILSSSRGELGLALLLALVAAKIAATGIASGSGLCGGLIGPTLVIGACLGAALGQLGALYSPTGSASVELYVLLGMTAMMAAVLNAPLAALLAVFELSQNPNLIFPAMLMIVVACVFTRMWFCRDGIFLAQLRVQGQAIDNNPSQQILSRAGVRSVMNTQCKQCNSLIAPSEAQSLLKQKPVWLILRDSENLIMPAADLSRYIDEQSSRDDKEENGLVEEAIDLMAIPAKRLQSKTIDQSSNLYEAKTYFFKADTEALIVTKHSRRQTSTIGIITPEDLDKFYG